MAIRLVPLAGRSGAGPVALPRLPAWLWVVCPDSDTR